VTVGENELNPENEIMVFPNPVSNKLSVHSKSGDIQNLELLDVFGKSLLNIPLQKNGINSIDMSEFSCGVYLLQITTEDNQFTRKVLRK